MFHLNMFTLSLVWTYYKMVTRNVPAKKFSSRHKRIVGLFYPSSSKSDFNLE